jgi:hypothetical protein
LEPRKSQLLAAASRFTPGLINPRKDGMIASLKATLRPEPGVRQRGKMKGAPGKHDGSFLQHDQTSQTGVPGGMCPVHLAFGERL